MTILLGLLILSIALAHLVAVKLVERLDVEPGHIREVMPTIPVAPLQTGSEGRRWNRNIRRVEGRILEHFERDFERGDSSVFEKVSAQGLAAELSEDKRIVAGALERMREEVDCRLRITRDGTILHDFSAEQLETLRQKRTRSAPTKLFMFAVAAAANIGAIWPVLSILLLAIASLDAMYEYANSTGWGLYGIGLIVIVFGATIILSFALHLLLSPLLDGPALGPMHTDEQKPDRRASQSHSSGGSNVWLFFDGGGSSSSGGSGDSDFDGEGLGQAIIVIILIAIIILCLFTIYIWLRGLWRAVVDRDENLDRISPAFWVRTADVVDSWEKWVPTNDLVGRAVRALRRSFAHRRPVDGDLGPRTLARAKRRGGIVSALEIALEEGLDIAEATEVGAELCEIVDGEIVVDENGELGFFFPERVLREIDEAAGRHSPYARSNGSRGEPDDIDHLWAEYIQLNSGENGSTPRRAIRRRFSQPQDQLPVNTVGLGWGHLQATDRLVGGTWIMALSGIYLLNWGVPSSLAGYLSAGQGGLIGFLGAHNYIFSALLFFAAFGATCLSAVARYTAKRLATHGVRRDIRRAAFHQIDTALRENRSGLELASTVDRLVEVFEPAWPNISRELVQKEVRGVLVDLEVSYDLDAAPDEAGERIDLTPLLERWHHLHEEGFETVFEEPVAGESEAADPDEVVFDTKLEHDHVTALA